MTFPETVTITREGATTPALDPESGMPTATQTRTTVYSASGRVSYDDLKHRLVRGENIGTPIDSDCYVYLPPGDHAIHLEDEVTIAGDDGTFIGRVTGVAHFTGRFYTRLAVKWQEVPT